MARVPLCPAFTALPRTGRLSPPSLVPLGYRRLASRQANKSGNNWLPLPWAIVALLILGFNEFMTLLSWTPILSIKLLPTIMNLMRKLAKEGFLKLTILGHIYQQVIKLLVALCHLLLHRSWRSKSCMGSLNVNDIWRCMETGERRNLHTSSA
ncbi:hypothetical protein Ahy_B04g072181 isoform A [Arachis hypogaea]|uniref:Sey1/RHD3-like three-helix bundle domain-containing protein n=1 Tax=Arachis hypogaea TaxID=3818 RepID=A0A444ZMN2_ARAHY|nr:hypothetical protein Ahy_B04g072181 isoform A [Arachis hypogaea]